QADDASLSFTRLSMNSERSEFGDKRVRQAMSAAINREAISQTLYSGQCVPAAQPFPVGYFAHSDALDDSEWSTYDPDFATDLLADAGIGDGFSFTAFVTSRSIYQNVAQVIQSNPAEVGMTMELEV